MDMLALEAKGICLFCPEHLAGDESHVIYHLTEWWTVTNNRFPYDGARLHLLLIPSVHVRDLVDLPTAAQADFWGVLGWCRDRWGFNFYGLGARCGDFRFTGATLEHLHLHLMVGDVSNPDHEPVRMKFSSPQATL